MFVVGVLIVGFTACNKRDKIREQAMLMKIQADEDVEESNKEIDAQFIYLLRVRSMYDLEKHLMESSKGGNISYTSRIQAEKAWYNLQSVLADMNVRYHRFLGFQLTAEQDTSMYSAARDKIKAAAAFEIYKKSKQKVLDMASGE